MNGRQKAGVSMAVGGLVSLAVGILVSLTGDTPAWIKTALDIVAFLAPMIGLTINLPSNTNPK